MVNIPLSKCFLASSFNGFEQGKPLVPSICLPSYKTNLFIYKMKTEEYKIDLKTQSFTYNELDDTKYRLALAIEHDKEDIIREAEATHKEGFEKLYEIDSLEPYKIRVFSIDEKPLVAMIIYTIKYKDKEVNRTACGNYHFFHKDSLIPHPYAGSICW